MARYDGSIRINTRINTDGVRQGESDIRGSMNRISGSAKKLYATLAAVFAVGKIAQFGKEALQAASDFEAMEAQFSQVFGNLEENASQSLSAIANQAGIAEERMKNSFTKIAAFAKTTGMDTASSLKLSERAMIAVADSAAFYDRSLEETTEYLQSFLKGNYENDAALGLSATEYTRNAAAMKLYGKSFIELSEAQKQLTLLQMVEDANRLSGAMGQAAREADTWTNQVGNLKQAWTTLMASIGKIILPVAIQAVKFITNVINSLNAMIERLSVAAGAFRSFSELLTGNKSSAGSGAGNIASSGGIGENTADGYNAAADAAENLAGSTKKAAKATKDAKKAAEGYLNPLDEINKINEKDSTSGSGGGGGGAAPGIGGAVENVDYGSLAEGENAVDKLSDSLKALIDKFKELAGLFKQGFFDGLGDWEYRWDSLKDSIQSIKDSIKDIFTDPAVVSAADSFVKSVAYMLGSLVGATASIGLTIATNLLGGIALYLEQNKDRIKDFLIEWFDVRAEINYLFADLFQSIAYVFEAFASQNGQQLTANLIGIFVDAFMGLELIVDKFTRDILNVFIQPFVENKEGFRTTLEGFLGVLSEVTGTIKQGIDDTFDKLNEVYDAHFKPFFDSVAQGLSDLVGEFLEFWNGDVQPLLEYIASGFDELWKSHIQPLINHAIELLGKFADFLKMIWEEIVKPFISWIIQNVLPKILPIIQGIWDALKEACAWVIDIFDAIINKLGEFIDWLTEHKGVVEDFIIIIGSFIAAFEVAKIATSIAGIVSALSTFVTSGGLATAAATALSGALTVLGSVIAFLTSPIGLITIAVGTLIAGFVLLYKHSEGFRNFINGIVEGAKQLIPGIIEGIKSGWKAFTDWLGSLWQGIVDGFKNFFGIHSPSTVMAELGKYLMEGLLGGIEGLSGNVKDAWDSMKQTAVQTWETVKQNVGSKWEQIKTNSKTTFGTISSNIKTSWDNIKTNVKSAADTAKNNIVTAWKTAGDNTRTSWENMRTNAVSAAKTIASKVDARYSEIKSAVRSFASSAPSSWRRAWDSMGDKVSTVLSSIKRTVNNVFGWISDSIRNLGNSLKNLSSNASSAGRSRTTSTRFASARVATPAFYTMAAVDTSKIPGYATGQVIPTTMKKHLAILGDNNRETEVVSPLSIIKQANKESLLEVLSELGLTGKTSTGRGNIYNIKAEANRKVLFELMIEEGKIQQMSTGRNPFSLGTT